MRSLFILALLLSAIDAYAEDLTLCLEGWGATQSKRYEGAVTLYDQCVKNGNLTPRSLARTYRNYAITYRLMGEAQKSLEFCNKALSLEPQDAWNDYVNRGNALSDLGKFPEALKDYETAASLRPELADIHYNRGIVYERLSEHEKAKDEFMKAYQKGLRSQELYERFVVYGLARLPADASRN